ncbi:hypothetical protein ABZS66_60350, partial [Dactylosporangium sp. NPDC005572]|uniref:hypothetical protein n=1 Tax=Dactylosporangium sp. NPDC005572 TaxID=3156889 RepID=UPI0033ACBA08
PAVAGADPPVGLAGRGVARQRAVEPGHGCTRYRACVRWTRVWPTGTTSKLKGARQPSLLRGTNGMSN